MTRHVERLDPRLDQAVAPGLVDVDLMPYHVPGLTLRFQLRRERERGEYPRTYGFGLWLPVSRAADHAGHGGRLWNGVQRAGASLLEPVPHARLGGHRHAVRSRLVTSSKRKSIILILQTAAAALCVNRKLKETAIARPCSCVKARKSSLRSRRNSSALGSAAFRRWRSTGIMPPPPSAELEL
jgi:hypothetical protein